MTDFNDLPPDELASARFDSELPEDVAARVDADPEMVARIADQATVAEFVSTAPEPPSKDLREQHLAAALAAFDLGDTSDAHEPSDSRETGDASETTRETTGETAETAPAPPPASLDRARAKRNSRGAWVLAAAAALIVAVFAGGALLNNSTDSDQAETAASDGSGADESSGDGAESLGESDGAGGDDASSTDDGSADDGGRAEDEGAPGSPESGTDATTTGALDDDAVLFEEADDGDAMEESAEDSDDIEATAESSDSEGLSIRAGTPDALEALSEQANTGAEVDATDHPCIDQVTDAFDASGGSPTGAARATLVTSQEIPTIDGLVDVIIIRDPVGTLLATFAVAPDACLPFLAVEDLR